MKKLLLLALTAMMMVGCEQPDATTSDGRSIVFIDSCEYIVCENVRGNLYTHKGNCKFCAERRKQELKELVEQLKDR